MYVHIRKRMPTIVMKYLFIYRVRVIQIYYPYFFYFSLYYRKKNFVIPTAKGLERIASPLVKYFISKVCKGMIKMFSLISKVKRRPHEKKTRIFLVQY